MNVVIGVGIFLILFLFPGAYAKPPFVPGIRPPTPKEEEYLKGKVKEVKFIEPSELALRRYRLSPGKKFGLAVLVKNYQYLPVVGSQGGQGSCAAWSACYYYKTYQESKEHSWNHSDPNIDPEHVASPAFGYNLANAGEDSGSWPAVIMQLMVDHGCASWQDMPYDDSDYISWPDEDAWRNAIPYRAENAGEIYLGIDAGINLLKQALSNGDLATITIIVYENFYFYYPNDTDGINNGVLFDNSGALLGGHAMTAIGYDDDKPYFDGTETKYGAFLMVNSWGSNWGVEDPDIGTKGFCWISYDYMRDKSYYQTAWIITDKEGYEPTAYGIFGLNHNKRGELDITFMGGNDKNSPDWTFNCLPNLGGNHPVNQNIVADLTSYNPDFSKKFWLKVYDSGSPTTGQVTYMAVQEDEEPRITSTDTPKDTVNGDYIYIMINQPPNTPSAPTGDDSGTPNTPYTFTATTTDPDGDQVAFKFDWGDGSESDWTSYVDSGSSASKSHSWSTEDTYYVKVKAKDTYNAESGWSAGHSITIRAVVLKVDPSSLDFDEVGKSSTKIMTFRAYNAGGGTLSGTISVNRNWMTVSPTSFEGNDNTISVTISTEGLAESHTPYIGTITVTSNGGTKTIEVSVIVIPAGAVVYPNPFSLARHNNLSFWGTGVPYAEIRIFTLAGELVKTLDERYGASEVSWDSRNEKGDKVARGIYIYVVKNFPGKIAIIK